MQHHHLRLGHTVFLDPFQNQVAIIRFSLFVLLFLIGSHLTKQYTFYLGGQVGGYLRLIAPEHKRLNQAVEPLGLLLVVTFFDRNLKLIAEKRLTTQQTGVYKRHLTP